MKKQAQNNNKIIQDVAIQFLLLFDELYENVKIHYLLQSVLLYITSNRLDLGNSSSIIYISLISIDPNANL